MFVTVVLLVEVTFDPPVVVLLAEAVLLPACVPLTVEVALLGGGSGGRASVITL